MTNYQLLTQEQFITMPWKNGKGVTIELLRIEDDQGMVLRISQARVVVPGEFSNFSGLERHLVLIQGSGIRLSHQSNSLIKRHELSQLLDIAKFDGADVTSAKLINGAITDLNIMTRARDHQAQVTAIHSSAALHNAVASQGYFYANQTSVISMGATHRELTMPTNSLLIMPPFANYSLSSGSGVLISLHPKPL